MFENPSTPPPPQNPLNPVMPSPGMPSPQIPPSAPSAPSPMTPTVHTMPERFRSAGGGPKPSGSSTTKKLVITLVIVVGVAGLGAAGLFVFSKFVKTNTNVANSANTTNIGTNKSTTNTSLNTNTLVNSGLNTNSANLNSNTAANVNTVANTNSLTNGNTNTSANVNTSTNTSTNVNSSTTSFTVVPSSKDTDGDGLTDVEEQVYTTDANNADTDGDTFIDGMRVQADGTILGELANLYNPKGAGSLEASGLVKRIENASKTYSLLIPKNWTTNESSAILVITPTLQSGEFFQLRTYDNTNNLSPVQWYQANNPQANTSLLKSGAVNGLETLTSEDHATVYFFKDGKVYGLNYVIGGLSQANYWTTMMMMVKSFKLVAS